MTTNTYPTTSHRMRGFILALVALVATSLALTGAPAASAATTSFTTSTAAGTVGVPVLLTATSNSGALGASTVFQANGVQIGLAPISGGIAQLWWAPPYAGNFTLTASDGQSSMSIGYGVAATNTIITVAAPNVVQIGVPVNVTATVTSLSPSTFQPQGTVTFFTAAGQPVGTINLLPTNIMAQSSATVAWTPQTIGTFNFYAVYSPTGNPISANASQSPADTVIITQNSNPVILILPPVLNQGVPSTITAQATTGVPGTISFVAGSQPISGGLRTANGIASTVWTPQAAGTQTFTAVFVADNGTMGQTTDTVVVQPSNQPDVIAIAPAGQATWTPGGTFNLANGQTLVFNTATLSGSPATLSETGPCTLRGTNLTVNQGHGSCVLTASSVGGNGYNGVSQRYNIRVVLGTQTAKLSAPATGSQISVRQTVRLMKGGTRTNAGRSIAWRITSGSSHCTLSFNGNGDVRLRGASKGSCTVQASAPSVSGQWRAYKEVYTYKII